MAVAAVPLVFAGPPGWLVIGVLALGTAVIGYKALNSSSESTPSEEANTQADTALKDEAIDCETGNCPSPKCKELYAKIAEITQELAQRRADMLADRSVAEGGLGMYELFLRDPNAKVADPRGIRRDLGNWLGHRTQIIQKQSQLIALIAQYRAEGCSPLPPGAETQATLPPPSMPFRG